MNLVEQLLKADKTTLELKTDIYDSDRLREFLNAQKPIPVKLRQIPARKFTDLSVIMVDEKGNVDIGKTYDMYLMYCVEGVMEPSLKDEELMKKFGAATPKDLAERIFGPEVTEIGEKLSALSGTGKKEKAKVKN
jgi:hypothetical protein